MNLKTKLSSIIIMFLMFVISAHPVYADQQVHDQQHLLTTADIQQIHELNQQLQQLPHPRQIWVRIYQGLPSNWDIYNAKELKKIYQNDSVLEDYQQDELEATLPKVPEINDEDYDDYDEAEAAQKHADQLEKQNDRISGQVSFVIVYRYQGRNLVTFTPISNDKSPRIPNNFQRWYLHWLLPKNITNDHKLMRVIHKYRTFVQRHDAVTNQSPDWNALIDFWSYAFMLWLIYYCIVGARSGKGGYYDDNRSADGQFEEGYMYGYWQGDQQYQNRDRGDDSDW
ncbi:hypothetical protein [Bombilactobacillus bombi]|uniref:hypothetical protein n=1 Tax=Bombilactobacillus bombi TaxID=1303590 RepID=UPI0015E60D13|nr:hypothetical protein [Bombilactobacillus bombi]MBA1433859.1 hypothetical protein [Bombilactobacillus bombi]